MKEKLKRLNIRLTELSHYLNLSRPTLYKYIDEYENRKYKDIDKRTRQVFDFIKKKSTISKIEVIDFIINQGTDDVRDEIKTLYNAIESDKVLMDYLLADIHEVGSKGVVEKIKKIYDKEWDND
jgi:predicted transcriptional regulator